MATQTAEPSDLVLTAPEPVVTVSPERASGLVPLDTAQRSALEAKAETFVEELAARLHTVVRRKAGDSSHLLRVDDLCINLLERKVSRGGADIELSTREFELLEHLMRSPGRVFGRMQIYEHVWGYNMDPETNLVEVYIQRLRAKIDKDHDKKLIRTVRGVGYALGGG